MTWFFVSVAVFMAGHIVPGLLRGAITARIGHTAYIITFSVTSLFLLGWVIYEVRHADFIALWPYEIWQNHVTLTFMLPACILWAAAIIQPCPLSIGRKKGFDPARPGINRLTRHPLLLGMMLWGLGHIVPNGDLVAFMFFGGATVFAATWTWPNTRQSLTGLDGLMSRGLPKARLAGAISGWEFCFMSCSFGRIPMSSGLIHRR